MNFDIIERLLNVHEATGKWLSIKRVSEEFGISKVDAQKYIKYVKKHYKDLQDT